MSVTDLSVTDVARASTGLNSREHAEVAEHHLTASRADVGDPLDTAEHLMAAAVHALLALAKRP